MKPLGEIKDLGVLVSNYDIRNLREHGNMKWCGPKGEPVKPSGHVVEPLFHFPISDAITGPGKTDKQELYVRFLPLQSS